MAGFRRILSVRIFKLGGKRIECRGSGDDGVAGPGIASFETGRMTNEAGRMNAGGNCCVADNTMAQSKGPGALPSITLLRRWVHYDNRK